ncbi:MAG: MFS transporter [Woeseiaceae bacterium]|nr:MFS transporter [Woeseiaceae bacterium]
MANRNYLLYFIGNTISLHGLWVYRVALGWLAWELTRSEFWVGVVAFTQFAPAVLFGPIFGVLADRFDPAGGVAADQHDEHAVTWRSWHSPTACGKTDIYVLALLAMMQGILDGAHMPVRMALVPNLVTRAQLQSALATNSISFNLSRFIGPAIAGLLIASLGVAAAFAFNALSYVAILAALVVVRLRPTSRGSAPRGDVWHELKAGVRYVWRHADIRPLLAIIAAASVLGRGPLELLPAYADAIFGRGSGGLAILTSAVGGGAIVAGLILARGAAWLRLEVVAGGIICGGLLIAALGISDLFWLSVCIVVALGCTLSLCGVGSQILLQSLVDDDVRGRVSSLWGMVAFGGVALGGLLIGSLSSLFGLREVTVVTGLVCTVQIVVIMLRYRRTRPHAGSAAHTDAQQED